MPKAINLLFDEGHKLSDREYLEIKKSIDTVVMAASSGSENSVVSTLFSSLVGTVALGTGIGVFSHVEMIGGVAGLWLHKLFKEKDEE